MIKAIVIGIVGLIVGMLLVNYVILPVAADLLARPDLATWTGLGGGLRLLGFVLLVTLFVGYLRSVWRSGQSDE
jgi:hypothetical protein